MFTINFIVVCLSLYLQLYDYIRLVIFQSIYQYPTEIIFILFFTYRIPLPGMFFLFSLFLPQRQASSRFYDVWKILHYNSTLELMKHVSFPPFPFCLRTFCLVYIPLYTDRDIQLRPKTNLK